MINIHKLVTNSFAMTTGPEFDDSLCFTAVDAGATIAFNKVGSPDAASIVYATESSG